MGEIFRKVDPVDQLHYIAQIRDELHDPEALIRVRLWGNLYDYGELQEDGRVLRPSNWMSDRRPSYYLGFETEAEVLAYWQALDAFVEAVGSAPVDRVTAALEEVKAAAAA